jgi:hypothetical protein
VWFNDPHFFKMKPTLLYLLFAGILGFGLLRGQVLPGAGDGRGDAAAGMRAG